MLRLALELDLMVNIEIKADPAREAETAEIALTAALGIWPDDRPPPLVSSFAIDSLATARQVAPHWPRGYLISDRPTVWAANADALEAATINIAHDRETPESIAEYRATGRPVLAFTVNDAARARQLFDLGVASVFSDVPDVILAAM